MRFLALLVTFSGLAASQPFSLNPRGLLDSANSIKTEPDADYVLVRDDRSFRFEADGRDNYHLHRICKVLSDDGKETWGSISSEYSPWYQSKPVLRARVISPDGAEHVLDQKTVSEGPARDDQPDVFDDRRIVRAPLPAVAVGAVIEFEITIASTRPMFEAGTLFRSSFGGSESVGLARLELDYPESLPLQYRLANIRAESVKRAATDGRVKVIVEPGAIAPMPPADPHLPSDVIVYPSIRFATGRSWREIAAKYSELVDRQLTGADVRSLVTRGANREQTIRELLKRLHREIRYTGVEFGEAALIPNTPAETMKRKYGDCKDKSALLIAMLRAAGIPASMALLSTGPGLDVDPALPGIGEFDHAIVYVPGENPYWIDATDELAGLGELASADQGRRALIADPATSELVLTPVLPSSANRSIETRLFTLAEEGPAHVAETTEWHGTKSSGVRRNYLSPDAKKLREQLEGYVKNEYLAESLGKIEHAGAGNLDKPFQLRIEAEKAKRGSTDTATSTVAIRRENITDSLPDYLTTEAEGERKAARERRTADVLMPNSSITEWRYRIVPPRGYNVRDLPPPASEQLGSTSFSQEFKTEPDGSVSGVLRFDTGKRLMTAAEAKATRTAVLEFRKREPIFINFAQAGEALLQSGKIKEALREFRALAAAEPGNALTKTRIARALLVGGMGESARAAAREAADANPSSATAWSTLGFALQHDLVGRLRRKGFDREGALAAYKKAVELDPKSLVIRADYAILLEHDADGVRYSRRANLDQAIEQYRAVEKESKNTGLVLNLPFALLAASRFAELREATKEIQDINGHGLHLAAIAASEGPAAALKASESRLAAETDRRQAVASAANFLMRTRLYPQAAEMFATAAKGQPNAAAVLNLVNMLRRAKRFEDLAFDTSTATGAAMTFTREMMQLREGQTYAGLARLFVSDAREFVSKRKLEGKEAVAMRQAVAQMSKTGVSREGMLDIALSAPQTSQEGDRESGFRARINFGQGGPQTVLTLTEGSEQKILAEGNDGRGFAAREVLRRARANDLAGARKLLDWIREDTPLEGGDDPLGGKVFARLWERGAEAPLEAIEIAAAALMIESPEFLAESAEILERRRPASGDTALAADLARTRAYLRMKQYGKAAVLAARLLTAKPLSGVALAASVQAHSGNRDWKAAIAAAQDRLKRDPSSVDAMRHMVTIALNQGDWPSALDYSARIEASGKATAMDLNNAAWVTLFNGTAAREGAKASEKALTHVQGQPQFPLLHTLAAIHAESGKTTEARELMLQAMEAIALEEPNTECWYVFGRIAEQYGEAEAARAMYRRVTTQQEPPPPSATVVLARKQLAALR